MTQLLLVILDDLKAMPALLQAWRAIGVPGATILQSAGAHRTTNWLSRVGLGALDRLFESDEVRRRTLLTVVEDETLLDRAVAEAERVIGGFDRPNSGLLLVLPVTHVRGLRKPSKQAPPQRLPPAVRPDWMIRRDTPIEEVVAIMNLEPTIVHAQSTLDDVVQAMQKHPNVHVACVVNDKEELIGLIRLRSLANDLFFHIMPEEFLLESRDLEHALEYASRSRMRTAKDAMQPPAWVKETDRVRDAFKRMHEHDLPGLPVVDDCYRVIGYVNLLELLAACAQQTGPAEGEDA